MSKSRDTGKLSPYRNAQKLTRCAADAPRSSPEQVNALLPGGATLTGMILDAFPQNARDALIDPAIMVPPLLWLVSDEADAISGCRVDASRWVDGNPRAATESAGWGK